MRVLVGTVIDGHIVVEEELEEGASVTLLIDGEEEPVRMDGDSKVAFTEAMMLLRRGEFLAPEDVLD